MVLTQYVRSFVNILGSIHSLPLNNNHYRNYSSVLKTISTGPRVINPYFHTYPPHMHTCLHVPMHNK